MAQQYVLQNVGTLFAIPQKLYRNGDQWQKIAAANGNIKPENLQFCQQLEIP